MNRNIMNKLLVCALLLNVTAPALHASEVNSEVASEEVVSEEVASETSEVASEEVVSEEVASEDSEEMTEPVLAESEVAEEDFYLSGSIYLGDESTVIGQEVETELDINVYSDSAMAAGSTITFAAPAGIELSNLSVAYQNDDTVLVNGTDYTFENNVLTFTNQTLISEDLTVSYTAKLLNGTTDILGAESGIYHDFNDNGVFDGADYYLDQIGYNVYAQNGSVSDERYFIFESEITGGALSVENTGVESTYANGTIQGQFNYDITNTGDLAIKLTSVYDNFDLISEDEDIYIWGPNYDDVEVLYSLDGGTSYITGDEIRSSYSSTADEYLNPQDVIKVQVKFTIDEEDTDYNLDEDYFGSWSNFVDTVSGEYTVDTEYGKNIFGEALTDTADIVVTTDLTTETDVTEPEVTEPEVTVPEVTVPEVTEPEVTEPEVTVPEVTEPEVTEPEVTETDDDTNYTQMDANESTDQILATTGSKVTLTLVLLFSVLAIVFTLKFKVLNK